MRKVTKREGRYTERCNCLSRNLYIPVLFGVRIGTSRTKLFRFYVTLQLKDFENCIDFSPAVELSGLQVACFFKISRPFFAGLGMGRED